MEGIAAKREWAKMCWMKNEGRMHIWHNEERGIKRYAGGKCHINHPPTTAPQKSEGHKCEYKKRICLEDEAEGQKAGWKYIILGECE